MNSVDPQWVDNNQQLSALCAYWLEQPVIAIDTEFMRSDSFFPHIGLLQIADVNGVYLIDPLKIGHSSSLTEVLQQPSVIKVIHSCSQDLEVFYHYLGILPKPIFDTQVAAAFIGYGMAISYANLLKNLLGIDIPKQETRSNWLRRPLSESQLHYAALDVIHLLPIYSQLQVELKQRQRLSWVEFECRQLPNKIRQSLQQDDYYKRIKSAWKLDRQQLAVLAALCNWREQQARRQNVPRNRILKDNVLWELAAKKLQSDHDSQQLNQPCLQSLEGYDDTLVKLIKNVLSDDVNNYPELLPRPLSKEQNQLIKQMKTEVRTIAAAYQLPPQLLMCNKDYELILRSGEKNANYQLPESLKNWRQPLLEERLSGLLAEKSATISW